MLYTIAVVLLILLHDRWFHSCVGCLFRELSRRLASFGRAIRLIRFCQTYYFRFTKVALQRAMFTDRVNDMPAQNWALPAIGQP